MLKGIAFFKYIAGQPDKFPTNVNCEALSSAALLVNWEYPPLELFEQEHYYYYKVFYTPNVVNDNVLLKKYLISRTNVGILSGLKKNTTYAITVLVSNTHGDGQQSAPIYCTTKAGNRPEMPPQNVTCEAFSSQELRVSWENPPAETFDGPISAYEVYYSSPSDDFNKTFTGEKTQSERIEKILSGLEKNTNYTIWVLMKNSFGNSPDSATISCATKA